LVYASLGLLWFAVFDVFLDKMLPRLRYLAPHAAIGIDPPCLSPECDFSAFWPAGILARAHQYASIYNPDVFLAFQRHVLNAASQRDAFFYPPPSLLISVAISYIPFECGFFVWTAIFLAAAIWLLRQAGVSRLVIATSLLNPASLWSIELGQYGVVSGALLVTGLIMSRAAPRMSGLVFSLFIFKPQLGILAPAALLAKRDYKTMTAGAAGVALWLSLTGWLFGWPVWQSYLTIGRAVSRHVLEVEFNRNIYQNAGVSVFWMLRSFGLGLPISYAAQGLVSAGCMAAVWPVWKGERFSPLERVAMTVLLSTLAMPYGYTHDMIGYAIVLTALAEARRWRIDALDAFLWLWPAVCPVVVMRTGLLFTPLVVAAAAGQLIWRRETMLAAEPVLA
jgi:hypothetical protein